jgi:membrane protein
MEPRTTDLSTPAAGEPGEPRAATAEATTKATAEAVGHRLVDGLKEHDVLGLSAEIAYRFLFAVFPFGLFVAALGAFVAGFAHVDNPAKLVIDGLGDNLPPGIAATLQPELERLLGVAQPGALGIGALLALWAATGGTNALIKGMHRAHELPEQRHFVLRYAIAIGLTLLAAIGVIASFATIVGGSFLTQEIAVRFGLGEQAVAVIGVLRWPAVFIGLVAAVAVLYRYAPSIVVPWRWIIVGACVFALGWLIATAAFGFYVANVADYGATYGSLGAVVVLMTWFYLTAALLVIGGEVTASLARELTPDEIRQRGEERKAEAAVQGTTDQIRRRVKGGAGRVVSADHP